MKKPVLLSTTSAAALYIGALLGPSLLLLPGTAAALAGPASILAWSGLLVLSAFFARVFTVWGTRLPGGGGVASYTAAGLGRGAGRAAAWCFLAGVVVGAPLVCLIGGGYVAVLLGGGRGAAVTIAAVLLAVVLGLTLVGARATVGVQLVLVLLLVVLVVVAVVGSAPSARADHWTPFAPHGWASIGRAASVLMLSFVGWEAIAPMTSRLRDPSRQLPRVIGVAFVVTAVVYLALAVSTIAVLGPRAGTAVPLSDLLRAAIGTAGPAVAAVAAVALTLAATNAYLSGASAMLASLRGSAGSARPSYGMQLAIAALSVVTFVAVATGRLTVSELAGLPAALFLLVYLGCTASAVRVFRGGSRVIAAVSCAVVVVILGFAGWSLLVAGAVVFTALVVDLRERSRVAIYAVASTTRSATRVSVCR